MSHKYERIIIAIRKASLESFWSIEPGRVRGNLKMWRKMVTMDREELVLEYWFPPLVPYPLKDEVGMGVACVILRVSHRKGIYAGHLQWDSIRKVTIERDNIHGSGVLVMGNTIYFRSKKTFMEAACLTMGTLLGKFMRGSKLHIGEIKKQDLGVTRERIHVLLEGRDT